MVNKKTIMKIGVGVVLVGIIIGIIFAVTVKGKDVNLEDEEQRGREYMKKLNVEAGNRQNLLALAEWAYASNITTETEAEKLNASLVMSEESKKAWKDTTAFNWTDFQDKDLKRQFSKYSKLGSAALPADKFEQLQKALSDMQTNYATSKICAFDNKTKCDLSLEPDITEIFATSTNPEELKHTWLEWHKAAGRPAKELFIKYVGFSNEAAKLNGYNDNAESWLREYEQDNFEDEMDRTWEQMKPLYLQLHAYVRKRLYDKYGKDVINRKGPIPAHLLGNVWAQSWGNLASFTTPYPDKQSLDVTPEMIAQGYTPLKMFQLSDDFFKSLNLTAMPPKFWENSIIEKPNDGREMVCHASAWDFYDGEDFRIKQCTVVTHNQLETVHHEMGHIQYFLQYKDQPNVYKEGANPGFHEAVGDTIALSVSSPKHLRKIKLLGDIPDDAQLEINNLYTKGIDKVVFLPFALLLDKYRYAIFRGDTTPNTYNCDFWKLRESYQGLEPPTKRTEADFDAAAKYHVSADVEYARYYVSFIIQFQFHRSLCEKAGEYVPGDDSKKLTDCDIYESVPAGNALGKMLQLGSSRPWQDGMEMLTGQRKMDASGILEYFKPLHQWLEAENKRTGELIGWEPSKVEYC